MDYIQGEGSRNFSIGEVGILTEKRVSIVDIFYRKGGSSYNFSIFYLFCNFFQEKRIPLHGPLPHPHLDPPLILEFGNFVVTLICRCLLSWILVAFNFGESRSKYKNFCESHHCLYPNFENFGDSQLEMVSPGPSFIKRI